MSQKNLCPSVVETAARSWRHAMPSWWSRWSIMETPHTHCFQFGQNFIYSLNTLFATNMGSYNTQHIKTAWPNSGYCTLAFIWIGKGACLLRCQHSRGEVHFSQSSESHHWMMSVCPEDRNTIRTQQEFAHGRSVWRSCLGLFAHIVHTI